MRRIKGQEVGFRETAESILIWICFAREPLKISQIKHALAVEKGQEDFDEDNVQENISEIVSTCAGLVVVDQQADIIRLIHRTAHEYFTRKWTDHFPHAKNYITVSCVTYISFNEFARGPCTNDEKYSRRTKSYPFYHYASRHWGIHAREAMGEKRLIVDFLENRNKLAASVEPMMGPSYQTERCPSSLKGVTGMHVAAFFGLNGIVPDLTKNGHDINAKDENGETPLHWAVIQNQHDFVALLLAHPKIELKRDGMLYDTGLLSVAAYNGNESIVKTLLADGRVDPNIANFDTRVALHWVSENGNLPIVKLLLAGKKVDVNVRDGEDHTPLFTAVASRGQEVAELLLADRRTDPNIPDKDGATPLFNTARSQSKKELARLLIADNRVDLEHRDRAGRTALNIAASNGNTVVTDLLLASGRVDPNSTDNKGYTPLLRAISAVDYEVVEKLLSVRSVKTDVRDVNGRTPLILAVMTNKEEMVIFILNRVKSDLEAVDRDGCTALGWAAFMQKADIETLLLKRGANPESKSRGNFGRTPRPGQLFRTSRK